MTVVDLPSLGNGTSMNTSSTKMNTSFSANVKVLFVDDGNEDWLSISDLYKAHNELKAIPSLALECRLNYTDQMKMVIERDVGGSLTTKSPLMMNLITQFKQLTSKSPVNLKVLGKSNGRYV